MAINAHSTARWSQDIEESVDMFNRWFMTAAPKAFRDSRANAIASVKRTMLATDDFAKVVPNSLVGTNALLVLRAATCPPLARERLSGLAGVSKGLVETLEAAKTPKLSPALLAAESEKIIDIILKLLDVDLFPWIAKRIAPTATIRHRAATVVADRVCGAVADPIVRNAQEQRQLALVDTYLRKLGYIPTSPVSDPRGMPPGTYCFRMTIVALGTRIPVDIVIQPKNVVRPDRFPILIEAISAGDFTNVNKRRKEEAKKIEQIRIEFNDPSIPFYLLLCGYFDHGYLGYAVKDGIDWIWEHRLDDLMGTGI